jgi:hypothetical protein
MLEQFKAAAVAVVVAVAVAVAAAAAVAIAANAPGSVVYPTLTAAPDSR